MFIVDLWTSRSDFKEPSGEPFDFFLILEGIERSLNINVSQKMANQIRKLEIIIGAPQPNK